MSSFKHIYVTFMFKGIKAGVKREFYLTPIIFCFVFIFKLFLFKRNWINNDDLYESTNQTQWSNIVAFRRLCFRGHIARLDDKVPAKVALYEAIIRTKKHKKNDQIQQLRRYWCN